VLATARDLFVAQGYDATTVSQIARTAGVARTVVSRHFPDKAALHRAAQDLAVGDHGAIAADGQPEARIKILVAARELFSEQGFGNTATREIADRAGVPETSLFRLFGSKAALFREALFEPLGHFVMEFCAKWSNTPPSHTAEEVLYGYIDSLYTLLRTNSASAFALLAARAHEPPGVAVAEGQQQVLADILQPLENLTKSEAAAAGYGGLNAAVATRASAAMILATALFKEWFFEADSGITDAEIISELQALLLHGYAHRGEQTD
jgi:AcrR family transcriptional regulator